LAEEMIALRSFTLEYWVDDGWYVGRLKEVPGVFSQGASLQELEENIRDAYQLVLEDEEEEAQAQAGVRTKELLVKT
jgi:predicted RNase H-like HicB family nuclease